jgi:hypothetical protein
VIFANATHAAAGVGSAATPATTTHISNPVHPIKRLIGGLLFARLCHDDLQQA